MPNYKITAEKIDRLLPQTQCGDCGYAGCLPYAKAIVNHDEAIDRCLPGGVEVLKKLGLVLEENIEDKLADMVQKQKLPLLAKIQESECIGCTKCINACPVDAIIGAKGQMHTIVIEECTGCGLCIQPCPMDCIAMTELSKVTYQPNKAKERYNARNQRLAKSNAKQLKISIHDANKVTQANKKQTILDAVARVKAKRSMTKL